MFFEHAGAAVAVDLATDDITDVFAAADISSDIVWSHPNGNGSGAERRAALLARSALAASVDPLHRFPVPLEVRENAQQAALWRELYHRNIELPVIAAATSLVPPHPVQREAQRALSLDLPTNLRARAEELASGRMVTPRLVRQMHTYFTRHRHEDVGDAVWLAWGGDPGREWATRVTKEQDGDGASTLHEKLAESDTVDYDTLRLLPRAFSIITGPHTGDCDGNGACSCGGSKNSSRYPSDRALTYLALGGDAGREWSTRALRRFETKALTAAAANPDANVVTDEEGEVEQDGQDGTQPHVYEPIPEQPNVCMYCGQDEMAEMHRDDAVNYYQAEVEPENAHVFTEVLGKPEKCEICGKAVDDTLHKQAALAMYYAYKQHYDKQLAETQQYWAGKEQGVSAGGAYFGIDFDEVEPDPELDDLFERSIGVDNDVRTLFWQRRGSEEDDPLTYYVAHSGDDQMMADQLYVSDGAVMYRFDPEQRAWVSDSLGTPEQVYEVDDATALAALRALAMFPGEEVDLREVDPGEALLMEECLPAIESDPMYERTAIVTAAANLFDEYTPEERSENAEKQVRDANGRFAKSGSRVAVGPENRLGTINKINPDTQQVEVTYDDGETAWVNAKDAKVVAGPSDESPPRLDTSKIEGKPRSTANTPKSLLKAQLPQMDREALNAVIENYPNFIEKERAGRAARQHAQDELDDESRRKYEREQQRAEEDYQRRLEKIHGQGKSARDWIDRIYRKIIPGYRRRPSSPNAASILQQFAKKKDSAKEAVEPTAAPATAITDPAQSDVPPIYLAEVDENNQQAVLELLAMVPASTESSEVQLLRYTANGWVSDPKVLRQLRSSSPPAVVTLDEATFDETLEQVKHFYTTPEGQAEAEAEAKEAKSVAAGLVAAWGEYGELIAAGIPGVADTPSDIAAVEKLKRYWTIGEGGVVKIRWNTPGDMTRCMRNLRKYMPRRDMHAGYCAKLHHQMTGTWPGDRSNIGRRGSAGVFNARLLSAQEVIDFSALVATAQLVEIGAEVPENAEQVPQTLSGAPFVIPILAPIGVRSGDGRKFAPLSLSMRELPLPLMWQIQTAEGHDSSVIVGRIDSIERSEDGSLVNARGVFDVGPYGQEAERLVRHKFLRGVSVDLDEFEAEARSPHHDRVAHIDQNSEEEEVVRIAADEMTVTNGRVMGATLVPKPAFQEVTIELDEGQEEEAMVADGTYIGDPHTESETEEMIRSALTAAGIPLTPPAEWFKDPGLKQETPLTVLDDGRVYGHIATWNTEHVGLPFSTRPPRSKSNYAYFHTGLLRTADGADVPVGQITLAGGHAPLHADAAKAVQHYDDTASAFCDVHAGEDAYGIWVSGALRPNVSAEQVRAIRAAAPSGDWRPIHGRLELVAVCQVNVPGFPVTRARVASGHVYALVAAGTSTLNRLRSSSANEELAALLSRVEALEAPQREALERAREAALSRINPVRQERAAKLAEAREAAMARFAEQRAPAAKSARERFAAAMSDGDAYFRSISAEKRQEMAKKGQAMPNGGYPIANVSDLKNAIRAFGRAASGEKAAVRRHIKKRARALGKTDLIPESWSAASDPFNELAGEINDLAARIALVSSVRTFPLIIHTSQEVYDGIHLVAAGGRYPDGTPWNPTNHPRDEKGRFRQVIAELRQDLEGEVGTDDAIEGLGEVELAAGRGDTEAAQQAAKDVLDLVDQLAGATKDEDLVKTLREGYGNLAEAVANLPLVFGDLNEKYRFSDLPPDLKDLIEDLYSRADKRLDPEHLQEAGGKLKEFMAGGDVLSQPQISAELSRILRFLI